MTDLTPEAANVVHTATSSGQTAADSGLKPVLKLPFVELGDRYGIKPEALAIVGQGHDLTFINDLQSVHPMNVNGGLEADSMVSLGQANISFVAGNFEGSGLDWCDALDGYVVANDGGSLLLVDEAGAAQVLFEDDAGGHACAARYDPELVRSHRLDIGRPNSRYHGDAAHAVRAARGLQVQGCR